MNTRGFTLIELAAALTVGAAAVGAGVVAVHGPRDSARQIKDGTQIRNIVQAMTIFAMGNKDVYPLPSMIDGNNQTVAEKGRAKDTTANIMSIMIYNSLLSPELMVSPLETNPKIKVHTGYQNADPTAAVVSANALWDPSLTADFTSEKGGHISYAHLQPSGSKSGKKSGGRLPRWSNTFNAEEAIVCTRGPEITSVAYQTTPREKKVEYADDPVTPSYANAASNTFSFFKGVQKKQGAWWSGNVAFNDNHVDFIRDYLSPGQPVSTGARYLNSKELKMPDMAFFDETDDDEGSNNLLGIFIKAGEKPSEFKAIWD